MLPTAFNEENCVHTAPPGVSCDEVEPLSTHVGKLADGTPVIVSCWKLTRAELDEFARTGRVWLIVHGTEQPPVALSGISPFTPPEVESK